ncbi:MAG: polysaccharide lyase [Planctomycetota bacterium]
MSQESGNQQGEVFHCDFESPQWWREWNLPKVPPRAATVETDPDRAFESHDGKALRVRVDEGGHYGISLEYRFADRLGTEPESIYFQYQLRFASDWQPERGGKLPGIAATYGRAGWGGRRVDGTDGWSARGLFEGRVDGKTPIGFYCYHADMPGKYGENWKWERGGFSGVENNRWYRIEQYVQLNTPGKNDGVLRAWVDDQLVFEKTDVRMRDIESLKIENIWINVYYGGTWEAQQAYHLYIDDVTISRSRIGS